MSESNGFVTRDVLLGRFVRRFKPVDVRLGRFRLRSVNEAERSRFEASLKDKNGNLSMSRSLDLKCRAIVLGVDDGNGNQMYSNSDIEFIRQQDSRDVNELAMAIVDFWGLIGDDIEDLEKNLEATVGASSP